MFRGSIAGVLLLLAAGRTAVAGDLAQLARQGQWSTILRTAGRRESQLPVTGAQAMVAAEAARRLGYGDLRRHYLEAVLPDELLQPVARVELAEMIVTERPQRAVELVLPLLGRAPSREIRAAAVQVASQAVRLGIPGTLRARLRSRLRGLRHWSRRPLEVELALTGARPRHGLERILQTGRTDLADLRAAESLLHLGPETPRQRWLVARSLYRHGAYREALSLLKKLTTTGLRGVTLWKARFLRGRCVFRLQRWRQAAAWYRKARATAHRREDRASLLVHEARALELAGDLGAAAQRARDAVRTRSSDERRLYSGRLELARGHRSTAASVFSRIRSTTAKDRALLLLAMDAHSRGGLSTAAALLARVRGRSWRGPALVLAAECVLERSDPDQAATLLESASATILDQYWSLQVLRMAQQLPHAIRRRWNQDVQRYLVSGASPSTGSLRRWALLVTNPGDRAALGRLVADSLGLAGASAPMTWRSELARTLWEAGLPGEAARWDPRGFPGATPHEQSWSARQFLLAGRPAWAIRMASSVSLRLGEGFPPDLLPNSLQRGLFPLPSPGAVRRAAAAGGIPWQLLAAVVREESRWNPRALSAVGARGLTQLMRGTARRAAGRLRLPAPSPEDLFQPAIGLRLGAAELADLLTSFEGRRAPAVAAYNAGRAQARLWMGPPETQCGDPCYVARIGFAATRSYTAHVLAAEESYDRVWGASMVAAAAGTGRVTRPPQDTGAAPPEKPGERQGSSPPGGPAPHGSTPRSPR